MIIPIFINYEIPLNQIQHETEARQRQIESQLNASVDDVLKFIENAQILAYTANDNPPRPAGSDYERTFTLRRASKTKRTGTRLPEISGEWYVDEGIAPYGKYVLGSRADQARIHRGRWKSEEDVRQEAQRAAPGILQEKLK